MHGTEDIIQEAAALPIEERIHILAVMHLHRHPD
jgi:hypothetical protein